MIANDSHETPVLPSSADLDAAEERVREATGGTAGEAFERLAHDLWYEGGRLRANLTASLVMHPENWHAEGLQQRLDAWDAVAQRYFDRQIAAQTAATPETT